MKVLEDAAFGAAVGAVTGGAGYFLNSASTVSSMRSTFGVSNAAIAQTALNAGSINMISMYGSGERDFGKLAGYFGAGLVSGALAATRLGKNHVGYSSKLCKKFTNNCSTTLSKGFGTNQWTPSNLRNHFQHIRQRAYLGYY